jgi:hypothetical protein
MKKILAWSLMTIMYGTLLATLFYGTYLQYFGVDENWCNCDTEQTDGHLDEHIAFDEE